MVHITVIVNNDPQMVTNILENYLHLDTIPINLRTSDISSYSRLISNCTFMWLHLTRYLEPSVAPNSQSSGANGWLKIAK